MATIVTRAGKGSALTFVEGDANFTNLNESKIEAVADDAAPQLGGDLDVNNNKITTTVTNGNIVVEANGTGAIKIKNPLEVNITDSGTTGFKFETNAYNDAVISSTGTSQWIVLQPNTGGGTYIEGNTSVNGHLEVKAAGDLVVKSGNITNDSTNGNITLLPNGVGQIILDGNLDVQGNIITTSTTDGNIVLAPNGAGVVELGGDAANGYDGAVLIRHGATDGNGVIATDTGIDLAITTDAGSGLGAYLQMFAAGGIELTSNGSTTIDGIAYPNADGTAGQFITTDGAGNLSFADAPAAGISNVVADTTPQLGGNLDVNGNSIVSVSNGNIVLAPNGTGMTMLNNIEYHEKIHSLGTTSGTITPDVANGNVQTITLNGNLTFSAFSNPIAGQSLTLIVNTNGTSRTLTSTMKFTAGDKTISTTNTTDIISVFYDGTNYWASLAKDFK